MGTYTVVADTDYRNEGWTLSTVSSLTAAWSNDDDAKYASGPGTRGRAAVRFPIDISSTNIPTGAVVTSVTIMIRVMKTSSDHKSVTVNVLSTENTARYTSRTLYPTTSFANYEVGTYTVDPVGKAWDKDRLNKLAVQVFSYNVPPNDGVRVAKLYAIINYKTRPTVTVSAPTGTVATPSPTLTWAYSQTDGDIQRSAEYKIFSATTVASSVFDPDKSTATYSGTVSGDLTSLILHTSLLRDNYYAFVRVTSAFGAVSAWTSRAFSVSGVAPGVPGGGVGGGIGTGAGAGFVSALADSATSNAFLTLRDGSNLLSVQQASFETDTDSLGYTGTNCTLSYDVTEFYSGFGSMQMSSTGAGDMKATSAFMEVAPDTGLTARAQVKAAVSARTVNLNVLFYDDTFTLVGASTAVGTITDATDTYTEAVVSATSPSSATDSTVYVRVEIQVVAAGGAAEIHNVDQVGLMYGTDSEWSSGGHTSRNILSAQASDGNDPITVEEWQAGNAASTFARVTPTGTGSEGTKMFKMTYAGVTPTVAYGSTGTVDSQTSSGTGFTLNKPASVADGDLLVAYVASDAGVVTQANAPTGWTVVNAVATSGTVASLSVLMRDGLAADAATAVGNLSATGTHRRSVVVRYTGAAATSAQLLTQALVGATTGSAAPATPTLINSIDGALRLSAFSLRAPTASAGSMTGNIAPTATPLPIAYVGRGAVWSYGGAQGSFTINKPSGVVSGDLMLAFVSLSGGTSAATAPSGWTQVARLFRGMGNNDDHSGACVMYVYKRTAGGSEPTAWTSTYTGAGTPLMSQSVAYRNCDTAANQFIDTSVVGVNGGVCNTAVATNTNAKAWRVSAFTFTTPYGAATSSNEVKERCDNATSVGAHPDVQIGVYDSNGPVSTGNHTRQGTTAAGGSAWIGLGWMGLLKPTTAVSPGGNDNERTDGGTHASSTGIHLGVYDASASVGSQRVYGTYTPSSGTVVSSTVAWQGFLVAASPVTSGEVSASLITPIDISSINAAVIARAGGKVTFQAGMLGSTEGAPYLKLLFYKGNELIATRTAAGSAFNTTTWVKSWATFDIPAGTTRIGCAVTAVDRVVADEVYFDRVSVALGDSSVWRRGTGRTEHPVFSIPLLEYAEDLGDGYGDWKVLGGSDKALLKYDQLTGLVTFVDQMLTPLARRKYRARTASYGLAGDVFTSGYGDESAEVTLVAQDWWLKDPTDSTAALLLKVKDDLSISTASTAAAFQPLGADRPVVLTEGYKGDTFTITVFCTRLEYAAVRRMMNSRKTLFMQSNLDAAWWVRPIGDIGGTVLATWDRNENPIRAVVLTFTEVDTE